MTIATKDRPAAMWPDSGDPPEPLVRPQPRLTVVADTRVALIDTPARQTRSRTLLVRLAQRLRGPIDRVIANASLVANDPVLDMRDFAWTTSLREHWRAIRDEAIHLAQDAPTAHEMTNAAWRITSVWNFGNPIPETLPRCPATQALVEHVPGLHMVAIAILPPGAHIPRQRGPTKGLLTCHLGLIVPRDGDARMRIGDRVVRWSAGETLVFDDTYDHDVRNEAGRSCVVLVVQFERPLRQPGKWIADLVLAVSR